MKPLKALCFVPGPQHGGWYASAAGPKLAHWYGYDEAARPRFRPRCGHVGRWYFRHGFVLAEPRLPACRQCVRGIVADVVRVALAKSPARGSL